MKIFQQIEQRRKWAEDEQILLDQVRRTANTVIAPNAARYDREEAFPQESVDAVKSLGLNAIFVPEAYGGAPMSYRLYLAVVQTISEACASTGIIYATNFHGMKPLIDFGTEQQKKRLLPRVAEGALASLAITEAVAGSDATAMKMRFTPDGDDIIVDGGKLFITSGDVADLLLVFGKWSAIEDPKQAISALIVEKGVPGFEVVRVEEKLGHRAHPRRSSPSTVAGFRVQIFLGNRVRGLPCCWPRSTSRGRALRHTRWELPPPPSRTWLPI